MNVSYEHLLLEDREGGVRIITLNRPEKFNSWNTKMRAEMRDAIEAVAIDPTVRVVIFTGAGRAFSAGEDVSEMGDLTQLGTRGFRAVARSLHSVFDLIESVEVPVIAAVNGVAAGAGANIALACDLVIAAESASFIQAFCKIGLIPDSGGTYWLPRLVGDARAMGLALLGDRLPARQAAEWGLIWRCVPDTDFASAVATLEQHFAAAPTLGLVRTRKALHAGAHNSIETQLDLERDVQRALGRSADYREGVAAFMAKRAPVFRGR